jgi:Skp family chaperone for outer membrane proteins
MVDLALQIVLVVLLLLTITWCVIVHHRLCRLRADQGELEAFIAALGAATSRAEAAVRQMQEANRAAESTALEQERRARQQSEQLARLMDNAARVVKRLDAAVEQGPSWVPAGR